MTPFVFVKYYRLHITMKFRLEETIQTEAEKRNGLPVFPP